MTNDAFATMLNLQAWYLDRLTHDVGDARMADQPGQVMNHPAWQIGHLIWNADHVIGLIGGRPPQDGDWATLFAAGTVPTADRSTYPSKEKLLDTLAQRRRTLIELCRAMSPSDLDKPAPAGSVPPQLSTVGEGVHFMMLTHEGAHLGQIAAWRRAAGLPMALQRPAA